MINYNSKIFVAGHKGLVGSAILRLLKKRGYKNLLIVDFLSFKTTSDYKKEDFVFYHKPDEILKFALSLSENVVLKHNYAPIPQKEFMLFIYK